MKNVHVAQVSSIKSVAENKYFMNEIKFTFENIEKILVTMYNSTNK